MSITVTCTFLKSNRFLLVGGFIFCGMGAARLTQRLTQHPMQLTPLTVPLNLLPPAHRSQLRYSAPLPPREAERSLSRPHSHVSLLAGSLCDYSSKTSVSGRMEIPPGDGTGSLLQTRPQWHHHLEALWASTGLPSTCYLI